MAVDIEQIEARLFATPGQRSAIHRDIATLISEIRRLQNEVNQYDPGRY